MTTCRAMARSCARRSCRLPACLILTSPIWIDTNCTFPNSMVDCIVPATGPNELELVRELGIEDAAPVTHENFRQWVIEDDFCAGRPDWDKAGATFTDLVHDLRGDEDPRPQRRPSGDRQSGRGFVDRDHLGLHGPPVDQCDCFARWRNRGNRTAHASRCRVWKPPTTLT